MKALLTLIMPAFCILITSCSNLAVQQGKVDAKQELSKGNLALEAYGFRMVSEPSKGELLLKEHGIQIRYVAGCAVNDKIINHAKGFNKVMKKAIQEQHENLSLDHY